MKCNRARDLKMEFYQGGGWLLLTTVLFLAVSTCYGRAQHRHGNGECPNDVTGETEQCFQHYNTFLLGANIENFYTGVDAEDIRQICLKLKQAAHCAQRIISSCPDTEHADIERVLQEYISIYEMCHERNFWERYARNQNCYLTQGPSSEECYHKFRMSTGGGANEEAQNGDPAAVRQLCSELDELVLCIQRRISISCNQEASELVALIVKPSVYMSEKCRNGTLNKPTSQSTPTVREGGKHDANMQEGSDFGSSSSNPLRPTGLCWLLVVLLWTKVAAR